MSDENNGYFESSCQNLMFDMTYSSITPLQLNLSLKALNPNFAYPIALMFQNFFSVKLKMV
jgi:hypothetical protein